MNEKPEEAGRATTRMGVGSRASLDRFYKIVSKSKPPSPRKSSLKAMPQSPIKTILKRKRGRPKKSPAKELYIDLTQGDRIISEPELQITGVKRQRRSSRTKQSTSY